MKDEQPRPNLSADEAYLAKARDMIKSKGPLEDIHFEYLTEAFEALGISTDAYAGVTSVSVPDETRTAIEAAFKAVESLGSNSNVLEKLYRLWDYLAESDPLGHADLIYVRRYQRTCGTRGNSSEEGGLCSKNTL